MKHRSVELGKMMTLFIEAMDAWRDSERALQEAQYCQGLYQDVVSLDQRAPSFTQRTQTS